MWHKWMLTPELQLMDSYLIALEKHFRVDLQPVHHVVHEPCHYIGFTIPVFGLLVQFRLHIEQSRPKLLLIQSGSDVQ